MRLRHVATLLHRWAGLTASGFLLIVGLTGSLLAFYSELDALLNPALYPPLRPQLQRLDMATLAAKAEAIAPHAVVTSVYLREPERAEIRVSAKPGASALGFDSLLLDPYSGAELGRLTWGDISAGSINLMPFIYRLHYELALGSIGVWILGIIALVWTLDCFIGFYLTLPARPRQQIKTARPSRWQWWRRWRAAWRIKRGASRFRLNYDLHRAGGLWLWIVLLTFAWSGVYMNLWDTVYTWTTRAVMDYRPSWTEVASLPASRPTPALSWQQAQTVAMRLMDEQAAQHGIKTVEAVALRYSPETGTYTYKTRTDSEIQDRRGATELIFDGNSGEFRTLLLPTGQYSGNTVTNWLSALHMANVFGLPYRVFVSLLGLLVGMLSITGGLIWLQKRRRRVAV